jgi:hypothetical protein
MEAHNANVTANVGTGFVLSSRDEFCWTRPA